MNNSLSQYYHLIKQVQNAIAKVDNTDDALKAGLQTIVDTIDLDYAILWSIDESEKLTPFFWYGNLDFTLCSHEKNDGIVGRTFVKHDDERHLEYHKGDDPATDIDFDGENITSIICVPFDLDDQPFGCIEVVRTEGKPGFDDELVDTLEIMTDFISLEIADSGFTEKHWEFENVLLSARDIKREFISGDSISHVLKGVNLDIYEGEFLVVLGESGCGKSTFLNIIGGMDKATSGSFTFMGKEMADATEDELTMYRRHNIGFVFQSYNLMPNLNAKQNLELIAELVDNPMDVDRALQIVGLGEKGHSYPSQLSGGQQQRISIARALVKNPKLIFADEPTAALDYTTSIEVLSVFEEVVRAGSTLVMVTHNEEITRMADRVCRMRNGKIYQVSINKKPVHATELVW